MPTRCTSRRSSSSTRRSGRASPTGPTSWRRASTRRAGCSASSATRTCRPTSIGRCSRSRSRWARGDVQPGPGRRLLRDPGRRGRRPVLRRRRTAAHGLHLVRQLQHRLRPQRQEQADHELPLPGGEARRRGPRAARGARPHPARRRRVRGACAPPRLGAASRAPAPAHVHRRAGDRRRARVRLGQAAASPAAPGPADRPVERSSASERGRTPSSCSRHPDRTASGSAIPSSVHITPGSVAITSGVWPDAVDEHRAHLLGRRQRPVRAPGDLPPARRAEAPDRSPGSRSWSRHPGKVLGFDDARHWSERTFIALCMQTTDTSIELYWHDGLLRSRPSGTPPSVHIPVIEDFVDRLAKTAGQPARARCCSRSSTATPPPTSSAGSRSARPARAAPSTPTCACSASPACTSWTAA